MVLVSIVTGVGLAACLTFVVGYWWRTGRSWFRDEAGRFFMAFMGTLGLLFALVLANQWLDGWPGRQAVTLVVFMFFVLLTWWPLRLLYVAQSRATAVGRGRDRVMEKDSFWWRLIHLEPMVWRAAVVAVVALLGALGILVDPSIPDALVTAWVALAAIAQTVWTRPAVTANARVVVEAPEPIRSPGTVVAGEAVTQASDTEILTAAKG
jgi:hypothetical protein